MGDSDDKQIKIPQDGKYLKKNKAGWEGGR